MSERGVENRPLDISVQESQLHVPNIDEICDYLHTTNASLKLLQAGRDGELPPLFERLTVSAQNQQQRLRLSTHVQLARKVLSPEIEKEFKHYIINGNVDDLQTLPYDLGYERKTKPTLDSDSAIYRSRDSGLKAAISLRGRASPRQLAEVSNVKKFNPTIIRNSEGEKQGYTRSFALKPRHLSSIDAEKYIEDFLTLSLIAVSALARYANSSESLPTLISLPVPVPNKTRPKSKDPAKVSGNIINIPTPKELEVESSPADMVKAKKQTEIPNEELVDTDSKETVRLSDLGGLEDIKRQIKRIALSYKNPEIAELWGSPVARTVLFYGPAGTGKTTLAQAMAHEIGADFRSISSTDINNMYVGNSGKNMENLFNEFCEIAVPTVILFDEYDTIIQPKNNGSNGKAEVAGIFKRRMNTLTDDNPNVIIVGTINNEDELTPDYKRRFRKRIYVPMPDEKACEQIWRIKIAPLLSQDTDDFKPFGDMELSELNSIIPELAKLSVGLTGSDIQDAFDLMKEVKMEEHMINGNFTPISKADFFTALNGIKTQ